jgi:hypothetical protein
VIDALGMSYARWERLRMSTELEALLRNIKVWLQRPTREKVVIFRSEEAQ